jgi:hypothetical protein
MVPPTPRGWTSSTASGSVSSDWQPRAPFFQGLEKMSHTVSNAWKINSQTLPCLSENGMKAPDLGLIS